MFLPLPHPEEPVAKLRRADTGDVHTPRTRPQRQLKNHPKIVNMIEASVADLPGGVDGSKGYEIYILMEWCQGQHAPALHTVSSTFTDPDWLRRRGYHRHDEHAAAEPVDRRRNLENLQRRRRGELPFQFRAHVLPS